MAWPTLAVEKLWVKTKARLYIFSTQLTMPLAGPGQHFPGVSNACPPHCYRYTRYMQDAFGFSDITFVMKVVSGGCAVCKSAMRFTAWLTISQSNCGLFLKLTPGVGAPFPTTAE